MRFSKENLLLDVYVLIKSLSESSDVRYLDIFVRIFF